MHIRRSFNGARWIAAGVVALATMVGGIMPAAAQDKEPIKIGFGMALTGFLSANGKSALLGMKIWEEEINASGGLLDRPVKLVYYDDQSDPSKVPGIYAKLIDVDEVDMIVSGYASNQIAPALVVAAKRNRVLLSLFGTGVNSKIKYDKYFSMIPTGPDPKPAFTKPFFKAALARDPKPESISLAAADAEFGLNVCEGARENAKAAGLKIVYDEAYPPSTADYAPIVRAIQAKKPDIAVFCSYPRDSVGIIRAIDEVGFTAKVVGGAMVGIQATAIKQQLGPLLNGITNYETWVPSETMDFAGVNEFLKKYQARAGDEGVDPLGYYLGTWGYAYAQLIEQGIKGAGSLDQEKLAAYYRDNTFKTIVGDVDFGEGGEWTESRMIAVQYRGIEGKDLEQFKGMKSQVIVAPEKYATGEMVYPYEKAQ